MSGTDLTSKPKKHKRSKKKLNKISFDEEIAPKSVAQQLNDFSRQQNSKDSDLNEKPGKNKIKQKVSIETSSPANTEPNQLKKQKLKTKSQYAKNTKANKNSEHKNIAQTEQPHERMEVDLDPVNPEVKQGESNRAKRRRKHQQLLLEKKVKVDVAMQEKSLNYLSRWKHNRDEWKFEKLRQVWLQQNMFDCDKVPEQFWETLMEYFSNAQGKVRHTILDGALKIIENSEHEISQNSEDTENENEDDDARNSFNKVQRARSMVQCLQE